MTIKPAFQKILRGLLHTQKMKINIVMKGWELLYLKSRKVIRINCTHTNPNTHKTTKWQESPIPLNINTKC
jgi:hypothetical protein